MVAEQVVEWGFWKITGVSLISVVLVLIFAGSISQAIQQNDWTIPLYKFGSIAILTTNHATSMANEILTNQSPVFELSFKGTYDYLSFYGDFLLSIYLIYFYIVFLSKIIGNSFISNSQNSFTNYFLGFLVYIILQSALILGVAGIYHEVNNMGDVLRFIFVPFKSISLILKAIMSFLTPISNQIDKYTNQTLNDTLPRLLQ